MLHAHYYHCHCYRCFPAPVEKRLKLASAGSSLGQWSAPPSAQRDSCTAPGGLAAHISNPASGANSLPVVKETAKLSQACDACSLPVVKETAEPSQACDTRSLPVVKETAEPGQACDTRSLPMVKEKAQPKHVEDSIQRSGDW